jgi:hypothetical protein
MIPAFMVALLSCCTGLFMLYEARKKDTVLYRLRWACASLPFFAQACTYLWAGLFLPESFDLYPCFYYAPGGIALMATLYWIDDIKRDYREWKRRHGQ